MTIDIEELIQDDNNFNAGTDDGRRLLKESFQTHGAGRSILVDKDGRIIAGNKSQQAAIDAGITKVRVIETTGDELIAVKRTDISLDSEEGRRMAYLDNLTTQVNLNWDEVAIESVGIDFTEYSVAHDNFEIVVPQSVVTSSGNDNPNGTESAPRSVSATNEQAPVIDRSLHLQDDEGDINESSDVPMANNQEEDGLSSVVVPRSREESYTIQYNIVFNDESEQDVWFSFIRKLKRKYPEMETISERLIAFINEYGKGEEIY